MKLKAILLVLISFSAFVQASSNCKQIRIAVIDTGLNLQDPRFSGHICPTGNKNFVQSETLDDTNGHGTFVASLIQKYARNSNYCLLIYKYYKDSDPAYLNLEREVESIREAVKNGAEIVNFSGGGGGFNEEEAFLIKYNPQVTFVVAAGNDGRDLDIPGNEFYPASLFYPNEVIVESTDSLGNRSESSNYGQKVEEKEVGVNVYGFLPDGKSGYMSGTSMATGIATGKLIAKSSKVCKHRKW